MPHLLPREFPWNGESYPRWQDSEPGLRRAERGEKPWLNSMSSSYFLRTGVEPRRTRNYGRPPRRLSRNEVTPQGRSQVFAMLAALTTRGLERR